MSTEIHAKSKSVKMLFEECREHPFVIPEYQRPYDWAIDEAQTLFDDIWEFSYTLGGSKSNGTYFLGSIVAFVNQEGRQEIIDGQQRITSLFLLLRAIYTKLSTPECKTKEANNFIGQIEKILWNADKLTGEIDFKDVLLTSYVINEKGNEIFKTILQTGKADDKNVDNYSNNYRLFQTLFEERSAENALRIYDFIYALLNQAILLPISANNEDTALTIFSTLNDRGMPLSDADIFKAKIYNNTSKEKKGEFIEKWQNLTEQSKNADENIQNLFYYYMFYLRASNDDKASTTPGLRKYYSMNKFKNLFKPELIDDLFTILTLWKVINKNEECDESWSKNNTIRKLLAILFYYPNEFWKYPVIIFYLTHREEENFDINFEYFLKKLIQELVIKYTLNPTINAVKSDILKLNSEIIKNSRPNFDFKSVDETGIQEKLRTPHSKLVRMLLCILAYDEQEDLLPKSWEIEHILPQKWQNNYFLNNNIDEIKEKIEHLGNKIPFEKNLNIVAGNGYFGRKKKEYEKSSIKIVQNISKIAKDDWVLEDIIERDIKTSEKIMNILKSWKDEYEKFINSDGKILKLTKEQQEMINILKRQGININLDM